MMNYQLVASDLDGTLLNDQSEISQENLEAINQLLKRGVHFVPASGRTYSEIPEVLKKNAAIRYFIHSNGAVILDRQTGRRLVNGIPNSTGREILDVLNSCETHIMVRCNGECVVDAAFQEEQFFEYYNLCEAHRVVVRDFAVHAEDFHTFSYTADDVEVFSAFFHSYEEKMVCKRYFEQTGKLRVVEASEYNLEIFDLNAGKGNALLKLAKLLEIDPAATVSMGDSDNDNSMIRVAGLGLVVSNGCDSLKEIADEIICSNEEHAIAYVLEHYFKAKVDE